MDRFQLEISYIITQHRSSESDSTLSFFDYRDCKWYKYIYRLKGDTARAMGKLISRVSTRFNVNKRTNK